MSPSNPPETLSGYEYEVFISYRRSGDWPRWVKERFFHRLNHELSNEYETPAIFVDQNLKPGVSWEHEIARKLLRSKVLVPLFSKQYFESEWCRKEFAHMLAREKRCGFGTSHNPERLIVPVIIHDGKSLLKVARDIQSVDLRPCIAIHAPDNSQIMLDLEIAIRDWAKGVVAAIDRAPDFDPAWETLDAGPFLKQLVVPTASLDSPPTLAFSPGGSLS